jgi:hypothetical protein
MPMPGRAGFCLKVGAPRAEVSQVMPRRLALVPSLRVVLCGSFSGGAIYALVTGHSGVGVMAAVLAFVAAQLDRLDRRGPRRRK